MKPTLFWPPAAFITMTGFIQRAPSRRFVASPAKRTTKKTDVKIKAGYKQGLKTWTEVNEDEEHHLKTYFKSSKSKPPTSQWSGSFVVLIRKKKFSIYSLEETGTRGRGVSWL